MGSLDYWRGVFVGNAAGAIGVNLAIGRPGSVGIWIGILTVGIVGFALYAACREARRP